MEYINGYINRIKYEDNILYATYGTPAENLCFSGDTTVQTFSGYKKIKDITTDDLVYSFNEKEHKIELKPVIFAGKTGENRQVVKVTFANGQEVVCTPEHLFAIVVKSNTTQDDKRIGYVYASLLKQGARVKTKNGTKGYCTVRSVEYLDEAIDVYDITVADNHNFFVGGAHGVLVHNCGKQIEQFRKIYGVVENVSDKAYVSNSFHCHVSEDINPIEKQDLEGRFWDFFNGGKIQYVRYPVQYNTEAIDTLIKRAMKKGFYEGVNLSLAYCDDCGYEQLEMDVCPKCGSKNITKIDRMNGYLAYSRIHGDTRLNDAKMAEIKDRKSM